MTTPSGFDSLPGPRLCFHTHATVGDGFFEPGIGKQSWFHMHASTHPLSAIPTYPFQYFIRECGRLGIQAKHSRAFVWGLCISSSGFPIKRLCFGNASAPTKGPGNSKKIQIRRLRLSGMKETGFFGITDLPAIMINPYFRYMVLNKNPVSALASETQHHEKCWVG